MSELNPRQFAVITGISSKLGMEMARQFASHGYDLLITSPSDGIANAEDDLRTYGTQVIGLEVKLETYRGTEKLYETIKSFNRPVDVLVMTCIDGVSGEFNETALKREIHLINHNIVSVIHLTKLMLRDMMGEGQGKILLASAFPAANSSPLETIYGASMAFLTSFVDSIQHLARTNGVTVTTMIPVIGEENQFENDVVAHAREGYEALVSGRSKVFEASLKNKLQNWANQIIPDKIKTEFQRRVNEANSRQ
ncbi:SDR family NAD(P)-dependent oxidoreductase [Peredibacter starrii]|uniref:SDR family NAD(P)-dependent oxidoreductase n=1 Tax=Peredibacter starrii TaxID=28202 RepID=A0AAX4HLG1_9BACT|nr:SDR family NAD(P)-dependent oxidoreductase [Peredibacter starrii]WPU64099.1 SDR family NAD(P)-dependent oxidoreductase [Peredibacter starrii]